MRQALHLDDAPKLALKDLYDLDQAYGDFVDQLPNDNRQGVFHPSANGMCGRMNVYEYIRAPRDAQAVTGESREIFDVGHHVHDLVQSRFEAMAPYMLKKGIELTFRREVPCDYENDELFLNFGIGGTTDGILELRFLKTGLVQRSVIEIKSSADKAFDKLRKPYEDHVDQAMIYAFRFKCPVVYIWYFNKNNSRRKVYPVVYSEDRLNEILTSRYIPWLQHVADGTLPDKAEDYFSCKDCAYAKICQPKVLKKYKKSKDTPSHKGALSKKVVA